jgi:hypothetical protein
MMWDLALSVTAQNKSPFNSCHWVRTHLQFIEAVVIVIQCNVPSQQLQGQLDTSHHRYYNNNNNNDNSIQFNSLLFMC